MKLRPEQTIKNKLISILDDIEEKLEEMQKLICKEALLRRANTLCNKTGMGKPF